MWTVEASASAAAQRSSGNSDSVHGRAAPSSNTSIDRRHAIPANRRGDLVKLLWWDGDGPRLFAKRLERGMTPAAIIPMQEPGARYGC